MITNTIIYDCDGVIVNSKESIISYYNWIMEKCGLAPIDWTNEELKTIALSYADKDILEVLACGDKALYEKMAYIAKSESKGNDFSELTLEKNIKETLEILKEMNFNIAVFTNRGRSLPKLLDYFGLGGYFDMLVTANDVSLPKPSPEGIYNICEKLKVNLGETLFIGDSPTDYYAAKNAGIPFLAYHSELFEAEIIHDHMEVFAYLKK